MNDEGYENKRGAFSKAEDRSIEQQELDYSKIRRKIDLQLLPLTSIGFFLLNLSRACFANALELNNDEDGATMKEQLSITDARYSQLIMVYTGVFIAFELPSNLFLKWFGARQHLSRIAVGWGIVGICGAAPTDYEGMAVNRLFLAVTQAGYVPCVFTVFGTWYSEAERALRFAIFVAAAILSSAFSGLIATGCSFLNGKAHLAGWRWLFIVTGGCDAAQLSSSHSCPGIPSVLIGVTIFFLLPNSPETAAFLTEEEKSAVARRVGNSKQPSKRDSVFSTATTKDTHFDIQDIFVVLKDWTFWYMTFMYILVVMSSIPVALFLPSLIASLGFRGINTQLMTIPVSVFTCICTLLSGWASDKAKNRPVFIASGLLIVAVGYIMFVLITQAIAGQIVALFLCSLGPAAEIPMAAYALTHQNHKG